MQVKDSDINEDDEVDIVTVEKDSAFSDSDMSQEELCFLPAIPSPDVPDQQDKCIESSSKLVDSNSGSPISEEGTPNGRAINHASSPLEGKITTLMRICVPLNGFYDLNFNFTRNSPRTLILIFYFDRKKSKFVF